MSSPLQDTRITQIGFVVRDLEKTKAEVARFLGVEVPPSVNSGEYAVVKTEVRGRPAPDTQCQMAFFHFGDLQVEFIQPNEGPSVWREFLESRGEGMHHLAFGVKGMQQNILACEEWGMTLAQKGEYRKGNGRYAYLDAVDSLKMYIELLESDEA